MSGVATMTAEEITTPTIGLIPRYLRGKEARINQPWAPEWDQPVQYTTEPPAREEPPPPVMRAASPTEDLRRRIAEAAIPERRARPRVLWLGLAVLVILVTIGVMFPDAFAALLPDVDASH